MCNRKSIGFAGLLLLAVVRTQLIGATITVPTDLNPGDEYRLVFVTSTARDALSSDIADYNAFVDARGDLALSSNWRAIVSTTGVDARTNTSTDPTPAGATGVPIYNLAGIRVADNYDDLWDGTIQATINVTELGTLNPQTGNEPFDVWTGTAFDGRAFAGFEMGPNVHTKTGLYNSLSLWIRDNDGPNGDPPGQSRVLYGITFENLTVPITAVPEPSNVVMLSGFLGVGLFVYRRRRFNLMSV